MNFKQITSPWVFAGGYHYGCNIPGTECYKLTPQNSYTYCFAPTSKYTCCMATLEGLCYTGICEAAQCPINSTFYHATTAITPFSERGGCLFENNVRCYPKNENQTLWFCYASTGVICDQNCTNPPDCNGNCIENQCMDGQTYDEETGYCCIDDVCCDYNDQSTPTCFRSGLRCARRCSGLPQNCSYANCYDPGCASWGMVYDYAPSKQLMGCLDPDLGEKGMFCVYNIDYKIAECFYNGQNCGRRCNYNGTDCGEVFLKECSTQNACLQNGSVIENCICTGQTTTINNISYCCPSGHTYLNGGCTLVTCPEGQEADENGICRDNG